MELCPWPKYCFQGLEDLPKNHQRCGVQITLGEGLLLLYLFVCTYSPSNPSWSDDFIRWKSTQCLTHQVLINTSWGGQSDRYWKMSSANVWFHGVAWTNDSLREIHNPIITVSPWYIWCIFLSWSGITSFFYFHNGSGTKRKRNTLVEFFKSHIWIFVDWMKYVITIFILLLSMSPFHKTYTWSFHSSWEKTARKGTGY